MGTIYLSTQKIVSPLYNGEAKVSTSILLPEIILGLFQQDEILYKCIMSL